MVAFGPQLAAKGGHEKSQKDKAADRISEIQVMERASPPVSPTVVAQILISQNMTVTAGTLLQAPADFSFFMVCLK